MFGISWGEFLVILLVGVVIIPARHWPDVVRMLGRGVRMVREFLWRLTDMSENIRNQIDLERPIDEMISSTTDNMLDAISQLRPKGTRPPKRKVHK